MAGTQWPVKSECPNYDVEPNRNGAVDDGRLLRSRYRALKSLIHDKKHGTDVDLDAFTSVITEVDYLHQLVQKPRDQVADAEALLDISNNFVTSVKSHANQGLTPDFALRLPMSFGRQNGPPSYIEQKTIRWNDLGRAVGYIFRDFRGYSTMLGPLTNELKLRKAATQRQQRSKPSKTRQPEMLYDRREEEETDTDKNMLTMFGVLRRKKQVLLESLILNRHSFAQTVENLFALSFLVNDGRVEIVVDEKGSHFVYLIDFRDWKLMVDMVPVGEELMPSRNSSTSTDEQNVPMTMRHDVSISSSQAPCSTSHIQDDPFPSLDPTAHENLVVEDSPERETDSQPSRLRLSGFRKLKRK